MSNQLVNNVTETIGELIRSTITPLVLPVVERNYIPDSVLRFAIRREIAMEIAKIKKLTFAELITKKLSFVNELKSLPIAIATDKANKQHYEVPDAFYQLVLGPKLKYSSCYWEKADSTLEESEVTMLEMYCERAGLVDGMSIVDLGCGWGSVSLYVAAKYPNSKVVGISNSNSQREYILDQAKQRGIKNLQILTGDIVTYDLPKAEYYNTIDRVISIEMFEHMKNYQLLLNKISKWIKPGGKLFVHIFTHRDFPGHYEKGWMTETFFTGGTLPSDDLLLYFQDDLRIENHWTVNGTHYQRTLEAWLQILDKKKNEAMPILETTYGKGNALKWFVYWRLFFIGCAEFFGASNGEEYLVSHYLFVKP